MGRRTITVCTDDLTGEEVPEAEVEDVAFRFGYDEYALVLTAASQAKVREQFAELVVNAPHKDHTPKWLRDQRAAAVVVANGSQPDGDQPNTEPPTATVIPPDNKTVREWWGRLTLPQLNTLGLKAPTSNRGIIPGAVMDAFVESHKAPQPAFSG